MRFMEKEFCRVRTKTDIVFSSLIIITGIILITLPTSASINILGFLMICAGLILSIVLRTGYKDLADGDSYRKVEKYFAQSHKPDIKRAISKEIEQIKMIEQDKGNGIRLDIYYNRKKGKAYIQLFEYVPYSYEPCSDIQEFDLHKVSHLIDNL